jgi:glucose-6-phosphate isomerase
MFDALKSLYSEVSDRPILSLFDDPNRAAAFSVRFDHMLFDYSKTNIDEKARKALVEIGPRSWCCPKTRCDVSRC